MICVGLSSGKATQKIIEICSSFSIATIISNSLSILRSFVKPVLQHYPRTIFPRVTLVANGSSFF